VEGSAGYERSWLVKTVIATASAQQMVTMLDELDPSDLSRGVEDEERSEEAFEATIIRLDGATADRLCRLAGQ
jgi:hypothetical protein